MRLTWFLAHDFMPEAGDLFRHIDKLFIERFFDVIHYVRVLNIFYLCFLVEQARLTHKTK